MTYIKNRQEYEWALRDFILKHRREIDLERTKLMLRTPQETLKAISRKEDIEFKIEVNNVNKKKNPFFLADKDHLPFAKLKIKIASSMPDAPKVPVFKINISNE